MLGEVGGKWLDRLHQHLAKDLKTKGWSQSEIAAAYLVQHRVQSQDISKNQP